MKTNVCVTLTIASQYCKYLYINVFPIHVDWPFIWINLNTSLVLPICTNPPPNPSITFQKIKLSFFFPLLWQLGIRHQPPPQTGHSYLNNNACDTKKIGLVMYYAYRSDHQKIELHAKIA